MGTYRRHAGKISDLGMEPDEMPKYNIITYNLVAKVIREEFPLTNGDVAQQRRTSLVFVALNFARRFKKDNPEFNVLDWLDKCSPNYEMYPLSELWDD